MKLIPKIFTLFVALACLLFSTFSVASDNSISAAACVIRSGDKLVLIKEILTDKLSLPAGGVEQGESPKLAAQREAWEETGLVVTAKSELGRYEKAVFYDCVSDSDIVAFQSSNAIGGHELPVWFAPHYGVEVASAMLIEPWKVDKDEYRFPEQLDWLANLLPQATDQGVVLVSELTQAAPEFHQRELRWLRALQDLFSSFPSGLFHFVERLLVAGNGLAAPSLMVVMFPLIYWRFGREFSYTVIFAVTVTSLLSLVAQQGFTLARPHVYSPDLALITSYGFSLPNLPIAIWSCVGALALSRGHQLSVNRYTIVWVVLISWLALAQFYSAAAFLVDSLSGALLGSLCAWHLIRLQSSPDMDFPSLITSKTLWIILTLVCIVLTIIWPTPSFTYWLVIVLTLLVLAPTSRREGASASGKSLIGITAILVALNLVLENLTGYVSSSSIASLVAQALRYPLLMVVFTLAIRKVAKAV
ncbi:DNA mismatch repair protein MutT [Vibrio galatheae]|uniref:DNA mismatch repair protein MutT n=1 Tax=Vibrio galatheae TaxID=579748 RepID=A0A0F4NMV4_9VIBR|nr:NUDIX hydrolase [Vibrio galatheae]KJY83426.1 DNA mismatch repair protein MutT [Vibrio galatheae]